MQVTIMGASPNPDRYSHKAQVALLRHGHQVTLVNPSYDEVDGLPCLPSLEAVAAARLPVETVTIYVRPEVSATLGPQLLGLKPDRVIFNPGSENPQLAADLVAQGIEVVEGCTLVMLATGTF